MVIKNGFQGTQFDAAALESRKKARHQSLRTHFWTFKGLCNMQVLDEPEKWTCRVPSGQSGGVQ